MSEDGSNVTRPSGPAVASAIFAVALLPVVSPERHCGARHGASRPARESPSLDAARLGRPHGEDEVRLDRADRAERSLAGREIPVGGRDDDVQAAPEGRRRHERAVRLVVGRGRERRLERGDGRLLRDEGVELAALREKVVVLRGADAGLEVDRVRAKVEGREVPVRDLDRPPARAVGRHRGHLPVRRLDLADDRAGAVGAERFRVGLDRLEREGARPHEVAGLVLGAREIGELRLAHREPRDVRVRGELRGEVFADRGLVARVRERRVEAAEALEPSLERGFLQLARGRVPRLEVVENRSELEERVRRGIVELHEPRDRRVAGDERPGVQREDGVRVLGTPEGRIREE